MNPRSTFRLILLVILISYGRTSAQTVTENPSQHQFWDGTNKSLFLVHAGLETTDFAITHHNLSNGGRESNPFGKALCESGTPGQGVFFAGRTLSALSLSYAFHRTGHHRIERAITLFMIGDSAYGVTYSLSHR